MATKKSDLYSSIWKSCDELHGWMDVSHYKDYVLTMLFIKYVSDKYAGQKDDLLGDVYEYLMRHFATETGKKNGQFYTPAEVSRILSKVVGVEQANKPQEEPRPKA